MNREEAWTLVCDHISNVNLRKHLLAVEAAMRAYAKKFGGDEEVWGVSGLLHDADYEKYPNDARDTTGHPYILVGWLKERNVAPEIIDAILGHADYTHTPRTTPMAKALFACDEICGFVNACALVRPDKLKGLEPKSVKKKLKDKAFAAKVSREDITQGIAELGIPEDEHIGNCIAAMQGIAEKLGF